MVYRAELFGYSHEIGPESVDAIYLPEAHELAYAEGALTAHLRENSLVLSRPTTTRAHSRCESNPS